MTKWRLICAGCALASLWGEAAHSQPVLVGDEFQVNTYSSEDQLIPTVAADSAGGFVVAWTDYYPGGSTGRVEARLYDAAGVPVGSELEVAARGYDAAAAAGPDRFVVTWENSGEVFGRLRALSGDPLGSEFQVNTYTPGLQGLSDVAMDASGGFVAVWENPYPDFRRSIFARRYDGAANPLGDQFRVNVDTADIHGMPVVDTSPAGEFVVAWTRVNRDSGAAAIAARRYDSAGGALGDPVEVDAAAEGIGAASGVSIGPSGEFVVVWTKDDGDGSGIFARRYDSDGSAAGAAFQVNTYTTSDQTLEHVFFGIPRSRPVAHDGSGRFLIAWSSDGEDGDGHGIFARAYASDGMADGSEMQINTYTTGAQHVAQVAALTDDAFVVIWESADQDGSGAGIFGQRLRLGPPPTAGSPAPTETPTDTPEPTETPVPSDTPLPTDTPTPMEPTQTPVAPVCVGDCDENGSVDIGELIRGVRIALGLLTLDDCPAFDVDIDGGVGIAELIQAVDAALGGCA